MSDTDKSQVPPTKWGDIITDMLILMAVMGALGYLCNLAMKPFEAVNPTDSLVSLIRKGDGDKTAFHRELEEGQRDNSDFVNTQDLTGRTPLMWAVYAHFNNPKRALSKDLERLYYVRALLKTPRIEASLTDKDQFTALHWAAWSGMPYCTLELLTAGLEIDARDSHGYTPLMLAALRGNAEVVEILLQRGADASLKNEDGQSALALVTESENAYNMRDDFKYQLIFSPEREKSYQRTRALLQNPPAPASLEELRRKMKEAESRELARKAREEAEEGAGEAASREIKAVEQTVEGSASAPATTAPDQLPSAEPQPEVLPVGADAE